MDPDRSEAILALASVLQAEAQRRGIVLDREDAIWLALLCDPAIRILASAMPDLPTHATDAPPLQLVPTA